MNISKTIAILTIIIMLLVTAIIIFNHKKVYVYENQLTNPCTITSEGIKCKTIPKYDVITKQQALQMCEELSLTYDYEAIGIHPMDFCK